MVIVGHRGRWRYNRYRSNGAVVVAWGVGVGVERVEKPRYTSSIELTCTPLSTEGMDPAIPLYDGCRRCLLYCHRPNLVIPSLVATRSAII
jgi:hypothetical protein